MCQHGVGVPARKRSGTWGACWHTVCQHTSNTNLLKTRRCARSHALLAAGHTRARLRGSGALCGRIAGPGMRRARAARRSGGGRAGVSRWVLGIERRAAGGWTARGQRAVELRSGVVAAACSAVRSSTSSRATARPSSKRGVPAMSRASSATRACLRRHFVGVQVLS